MVRPFFVSKENNFVLYHGDVFAILKDIDEGIDVVFADPPYFLSNNGLTVKNGIVTSVNKADWDKSAGKETTDKFYFNWLALIKKKIKKSGTIWISTTLHNLFAIGQALQLLDYRILNVITWHKTNPPPNFSKKFFTHSTEFIIWARADKKVTHYYNYDLMKRLNSGKQMQDYWKISAVNKWETRVGKHPTQKPLLLLSRIILASTKENDLILDPFTGSSTTGIAANLFKRHFIGIDNSEEYLNISANRKKELDDEKIRQEYLAKLNVL